MDREELIEKITQKKEFSKLRKIDVELAFEKFDKKEFSDLDKIKLTRDLLRKVFSAFTSQKLLSLKEKDFEWFLKKHLSTRERYYFYEKLYERILKNDKGLSVIDLGSGVNGFSYDYLKKFDVNYLAIDSIGQFIDLMNHYFRKEGLRAKAAHFSLFELEEIKNLIKKTEKPRIVFLFKTIDSLEMIERDYSKKLLSELFPLVDKIIISFATRSLIRGIRFKAQRNWILNFLKDNFEILDDFELGNERYLVVQKKKHL
ncbi:MAG: hypothetical protein IIA85_00460 [Nanoarchaeota archaeon]|nr:hypothetical protein [Nanoarchaeota archaeon]